MYRFSRGAARVEIREYREEIKIHIYTLYSIIYNLYSILSTLLKQKGIESIPFCFNDELPLPHARGRGQVRLE